MAENQLGGEVSTKMEGTEMITEEEKTWIEALRTFKLNPGDGSPDELGKFLKAFNAKMEAKNDKAEIKLSLDETTEKKTGPEKFEDVKPMIKVPEEGYGGAKPKKMLSSTKTVAETTSQQPQQKVQGHYSFPKLSQFSGDSNKGEVSWDTFRFEIESLLKEYTFTEEQVMLGIRRAVKGTASDIIRRLGTCISVQTVIRKLNSTYGNIESEESVMPKFYSCTQGQDDVNIYAVRLEDIYSQAVELGAVARNEMLLKQVLYQGLKLELKHAAQYKFDTIQDYDRFKIELRKLEAELKQPEEKRKTCNVAQKVEERKDLGYLENMIKELKDKIEALEKKDDNKAAYGYASTGFRRPAGSFRGAQGRGGYSRGRGQYTPRGRGEYTPRRPVAGNSFRGACHNCGDRGHFARDCPTQIGYADIICYRCENQGHIARDCQVDLNQPNSNLKG